jgi:hypothetical protein
MDSLISRFFFNNWPRKIVAVVAAIVVWVFVNQSIISTKTVPHVPIRFVGTPAGKTVHGLLPNGILAKRATLTISGTKDMIDRLEPGDIEVHIDATNNPDEWILQINKKNLVSLNPDIDLSHHVTQVTHNDFVIKMSHWTKAEIPVTILPPLGAPPKGYEFLDIWPQELTHTISGPEEQILALKNKGFELQFNLAEISKGDLDALQNLQGSHHDEISYTVPKKWKLLTVPLTGNTIEEVNDPQAQELHINFLRQELIPLKSEIPIRVFYPPKYLRTINPHTYRLAENQITEQRDGINFLKVPLYTLDVSKVFLDLVQENLEISITASADTQEELHYSIEFINPHELENRYLMMMQNNHPGQTFDRDREEHLRARFRDYQRKFTLYTGMQQPLRLTSKLEGDQIFVELATATPLR